MDLGETLFVQLVLLAKTLFLVSVDSGVSCGHHRFARTLHRHSFRSTLPRAGTCFNCHPHLNDREVTYCFPPLSTLAESANGIQFSSGHSRLSITAHLRKKTNQEEKKKRGPHTVPFRYAQLFPLSDCDCYDSHCPADRYILVTRLGSVIHLSRTCR